MQKTHLKVKIQIKIQDKAKHIRYTNKTHHGKDTIQKKDLT